MSQPLARRNNYSQHGQRQALSQPSTSNARHFDLDDDEDNLPASQISPNKSLSNQEHTHHVANVVKYILAHDYTKVPITKSTISKAIDCHNRNFKSILDSAAQTLKDVFGYKLVEVEGKFLVINELKNDLPHLEYSEEESTRYVLLFLILAHIYMSGELCTQGSIIQFLIRLGIVPDEKMKSDVFGDVLELITVDFVKEKYLEIKKSENAEAEEPEIVWGVRARHELSVRAVMEFVSKMYRGKSLESWPQQYEKMIQYERTNRSSDTRQNHNASLKQNGQANHSLR